MSRLKSILLFTIGVVAVAGAFSGPTQSATACPPIDRAALWLPADHREAMGDLLRMANKLNASGECVLEGSWGTTTQAYYLSVLRAGQPMKNARILRFTRQELAKP